VVIAFNRYTITRSNVHSLYESVQLQIYGERIKSTKNLQELAWVWNKQLQQIMRLEWEHA